MTSLLKTRWLPRFGLRSLFALVLLVAVYFGSWPWVKERARKDVLRAARSRYLSQVFGIRAIDSEELAMMEAELVHETVLPAASERLSSNAVQRALIPFFAASIDADEVAPYIISADEIRPDKTKHERYYLWLFGWTVRLPLASSPPEDSPDINPIGTRLEDWGRTNVAPIDAADRL